MERHRIGIVIPALNEAETIQRVVSQANQYGIPIVVDDGSVDETGERALVAGAVVIKHSVRRGYDQALNSGFARAETLGCQYIVTIDADEQHDPACLCDFIKALDEGAEIVIGIRNRCQRFAEYFFAWIASFRWGIRDPLCGVKAYRLSVYQELGHFDSYNSIGTELAIYAARKNKRIKQLNIIMHSRSSAPRFGRSLSANKRILQALWHGMCPSKQYDKKGKK